MNCRPFGAAHRRSDRPWITSAAAIAAALLLILFGQSARAAKMPGRAFSIATFNINWGNVDLPERIVLLRKAAADLVLLQETTPAAEAALRQGLRGEYAHMQFRGDRGRWPAERLGMLSKTPLVGLTFLPAKHGLFGTWIARTDLAGRRVQIVNVHLDPVRFLEGEGLRDVVRVYRRAEAIQLREIERIGDQLAEDVPTIVAGDFNSRALYGASRHLAKLGYIDSFASVTAEADRHPTWRWPLGGVELTARFDYIFHTREMKTARSEILRSKGSDHSLVVSRIEWLPEPTP